MNTLQTSTTPFAINSAGTTNASSVVGKPARLLTLVASNINAASRFLKIYDKATAPTVGTDIPVLVVTLATNSTSFIGLGPLGQQFSNGVALAITGAAADTDTTAVTAGDVKVLGSYI